MLTKILEQKSSKLFAYDDKTILVGDHTFYSHIPSLDIVRYHRQFDIHISFSLV